MLSDILIDPEEKQQNFITQYCKPLQILGRGAFSYVLEALNKMTGKKVAIKIIDKSQFSSQQVLTLKKESQLLSELNHPNIVRVTFSKETKNKLYIMMDLIQGVTLEQFMKQKLDEEQIKKITKELLNAIAYLHSKDIIHRDIKPENIMISQDSHVTLIDFGLSAQVNYVEGTGIMNDNCGTFLYMAPEMIQKKAYNRSVDIWAFGIVVFNLLNQGKHPFFEQSDDKQSYCEKIKWMKWNWSSDLNDKAINFLIRTVAFLPENRLTINQCLEHPWLTGKDSSEPLTFIEILKSHSLFSKIKTIIQAIEFLHFIKRNSQFHYFSTPNDTVVTVRVPRQQQIKSKSFEKKKNNSTGDSGSLGSQRTSQFKVTTTLHTKRQRNSCDQIKRMQDAPKPQFLFPRFHKSLDKSLKSLHSSTTVNTTVDNSFNQSICKSNQPDQNKQILQQLKKTAQYQRTQNLQQELISSLRVRSSKPPLIKKSQLE